MTTSQGAAQPAAGLGLLPALLGLVRFSHTMFALPFAFSAAILARMEVPRAALLGWITLAMVGARSLAMALNRLEDAEIDARNPRTAGRELPSGRLLRTQVIGFCVVSLAVLLLAVSQLPEETWVLWPIPVAAFVLYPYTKRFTWLCHLALGLTIGLAPMGAWLAVTGDLAPAPILLGLGVAAWIAGFDITYALLDVDFDRANGIYSIPARFGPGARAVVHPRPAPRRGRPPGGRRDRRRRGGDLHGRRGRLRARAAVREHDRRGGRPRAGPRRLRAVERAPGGGVPGLRPGRGDAVGRTELVRADGLVKRFGERRAVDRVDVRLAAGECLAVLGPNGAGKSTLLRMLATLLRPDEGTLAVAGHDCPDGAGAARAEIGYLGHDPLVYLDLTARQNLELYADLYGLSDAGERIDDALDRVGLLARSFDPCAGSAAAWPSAWAWRAPSSTSRACSCWTSPTPASTRPARGSWTACSPRRAATAAWSS